MTLFQASLLANIILTVIVAIFAIDRINFQRVCKIRHNPIDAAILEIKETLNKLHEMFVKHIQGGSK